jgi:hypothetical protein
VNIGLLTEKLPSTGLRYPRFSEKPPFQTQEEIERRIKAGGFSDEEQTELRPTSPSEMLRT